MKCANCGKEFGNGVNCQNCGIDRVAGLANYSGYDSHAGSNSYDSSSYGGQTSPKTTVCYACNEIIPIGATYCPVCGKKLLVTCPKCGHEYSSQYPVCSKCGTNREEYNDRKRREEEERQRKRIEEQEEERKRMEWEQAQRQLQQQNNQSCLFKLIGVLAIIIGCVFLIVTITEHRSLDISELIFFTALIAIGVGLAIYQITKNM
jgi:predicted RNA-binding Zn-ribbon protein involved in translation (DUF1610 family)